MAISVVDASAFSAMLFGEAESGQVASLLGDDVLAAPNLVLYELGNVCWKKCRHHPARAPQLRKALGLFARLQVRLHQAPGSEVLDIAVGHGVTFYDASYLWLAIRLGARLVSLDVQLNRVASKLLRM